MIDLHVHDAHFIRLLFGMPTEVSTQGRMRGEVVEYFDSLFRFADPSIVVRATSGVINQQGREFTHGFEIHLEKATLHFEFAAFRDGPELMPLKVLASDGTVVRPQLGEGDPVRGFEGEIAEVIRCVQSGQASAILSGDLARDAIVLCHKQTESARQRPPVRDLSRIRCLRQECERPGTSAIDHAFRGDATATTSSGTSAGRERR